MTRRNQRSFAHKAKHILPRRRTSVGAKPGTIAVDPAALQPTFHLFHYNHESLDECALENLEQIPGPPDDGHVQWLNIDGLGDAATIARVGELYGLHPLALEDVVNTHQRPKAEIYGERLFIATRMALLDDRLRTEQVTIFLGPNFVVTFQESAGDCLEPVRDRLRKKIGKIRELGTLLGERHRANSPSNAITRYMKRFRHAVQPVQAQPQIHPRIGTEESLYYGVLWPFGCDRWWRSPRSVELGADYLAYSLLDAIVDHFFPVLEEYGERIEHEEELIHAGATRTSIVPIQHLKKDLFLLRRTIWPYREMLGMLERDPIDLITDSTRIYIRDCYDHAVHILDLTETFREMVADLRDLYMTMLSNRANETMRVLTLMATIFIPLTFIAGVYGMNFDTETSPWNMPELDWFYGYPFALGLMGLSLATSLAYYMWQGWLRIDRRIFSFRRRERDV